MSGTELQRLSASARADLIYRAARAEIDGRLWATALGRTVNPAAPMPPPRGRNLLSLDTLVDALQADDRLQPRLSPETPLSPVPGGNMTLALGANAPFEPLLEAAAARTGLDPAMLAAIVDAEAARRPDGRWDAQSRNPRSTATGLGQFLAGTWLDEARRPGSTLHALASAHGWLAPGGGVRSEARAALLALRSDPAVAIEAIADHAARNLGRLARAGVRPEGLQETSRAAYLAHHLGLGDALRYLGRGLDEARAARLLTAQVGSAAAARRIAAAGSAADAHRQWLDTYVEKRIRPARFLTA